MGDEVQIELATATPPPPLIEIIFRNDESNAQQVIDTMTECIERKDKIRLLLHFNFNDRARFDSSLEMKNKVFENLIHIKSLQFKNCYTTHIGGIDNGQMNEHRKCFIFFTRIVQESNGAIQHFDYYDDHGNYSIDEFNHLATAIRSNKNGHIESFKVDIGDNMNIDLFQPLWNALLDTGIQKVNLNVSFHDQAIDEIVDATDNGPYGIYRINNLNLFSRLSTNKSLTELTLDSDQHMLRQDWRDLFNSIKPNTGLEKLTLPNFISHVFNDDEEERWFTEMLHMNTSLTDVTIANYDSPDLQTEIKTETDLNRMWKQCIVVSDIEREQQQQEEEEEEEMEKEKEEKRKQFKMRVLLYIALNKPVLRDTIQFILLSDYPDVFLCDDNNDSDENNNEEGNNHHTILNNRIHRMLLSAPVPPTNKTVALPTAAATVMELATDLQTATELNVELRSIITENDATIVDLRAETTVLQVENENLRLLYENLKRLMLQTIQDN